MLEHGTQINLPKNRFIDDFSKFRLFGACVSSNSLFCFEHPLKNVGSHLVIPMFVLTLDITKTPGLLLQKVVFVIDDVLLLNEVHLLCGSVALSSVK